MTSRKLALIKATLATVALVLTAQQLGAYVFNGGKWKVQQVPYYVNPQTPDLTPEEVVAAIQTAADAWSMQSDASIRFQFAGTTASTVNGMDRVNNVIFRNESNGSTLAATYYWYSTSTGEMVDFDMIFYDAGYRFFTGTDTCSSGYYVEDVGTHEFGHALGLGHSSVSTATMVQGQGSCSTWKRSLDPDDVAGVESLYPPAAAVEAPAAPSNLAPGGATSNSVSLNWADNSTNEDTFLVERSPDGANGWYQVASTGANARSYTDSGLAASTAYYYRVRASNSGGFSGYTNIAGTTTAAPALPTTPSSPTPADSTANLQTKLTLKWACSNATSYDVYLGGDGAMSLKRTVTGTSLTVNGLTTDTVYSWKVVAKNSHGSVEGPTWTFITKSSVVKMRK